MAGGRNPSPKTPAKSPLLGRTLHERLGKLADHFAKLGRSLGNAVENYNNAIGSFETRVLTTARKFEDLKAAPEAATIANLEPVDQVPRHLQASGTGILPAADLTTSAAPLTGEAAAGFAVVAEPAALDDDFSFVPEPAGESATLHTDDDFSFVPEPAANAGSAAADLRSALE